MAGSAGDDLASLLQSVTEEQEKATFDVPRFFKSYNSALSNELYGMMLESEIPLKRGKKRTRPSPELTALEKQLYALCPAVPLSFPVRWYGLAPGDEGIIVRPFGGGRYGSPFSFLQAKKFDK